MAQYARPNADKNNPDGWTDQGGGGVNIYQAIDEVAPNDADYVRSPVGPSSDVYVATLSAVEDPLSSSGHSLRVRYAKSAAGGAQINLVVELRQGYVNEGAQGTLIKQRTYTNIGENFVTDDYVLTAGEADSITDYADLYLRCVANQV